jgi:hypothetical protein
MYTACTKLFAATLLIDQSLDCIDLQRYNTCNSEYIHRAPDGDDNRCSVLRTNLCIDTQLQPAIIKVGPNSAIEREEHGLQRYVLVA